MIVGFLLAALAATVGIWFAKKAGII